MCSMPVDRWLDDEEWLDDKIELALAVQMHHAGSVRPVRYEDGQPSGDEACAPSWGSEVRHWTDRRRSMRRFHFHRAAFLARRPFASLLRRAIIKTFSAISSTHDEPYQAVRLICLSS